ncbi:MAG: D-alanyl-D-alanine carboxypeptidase [Alphaproteobacteria bacterium]|nr:D-alanyl-D-alanine carboxypeptidase [Alphaproteobacteria bacterium]
MRHSTAYFRRVIFVFTVLVFALPFGAQAETVETKAQQAFMIDFDTGTVLFEKNADEKMPTSSMSKVMTMYLVFDALKKGKISLDDEFTVSEKAWKMGGSKMFVPVGKKVRVGDLVQGVIVQSGNDATIVLAEGLAGSEVSWAAALNTKAQELGMKNSHFMNASGWPDPDHYSTARDLAMLSWYMINDFPEYYPYFSEKDFTYNDIKQGNRNPLLYRGIGADGIKTGHTEDGGYGLMASGIQDGRRVILVANGMASQQERADESAKLLQWGMSGFQNLKLVKAGQIVEEAPVAMGGLETVPLAVSEDVVVTVPKLSSDEAKAEISYNSPLIAPVKKGDKVGTLFITLPGGGEAISIPLLADKDVAELGFFPKTFAKISYFLSSRKDEVKQDGE